MIVKILGSSPAFSGVQYNTQKVDNGKGELMQVSNFGALMALGNLRPEDYKNYLMNLASLNKNITNPQFHAVISAAGKEHNKFELTEIANQWIKEMGYGEQPFLIVYHKDTDNNHVHLVSSRVDKQGVHIPDSFEKIKAIERLNKVMSLDPVEGITKDLESAFKYQFSTKNQFYLLMENKGYGIIEDGGRVNFAKYGKVLGSEDIDHIINVSKEFVKDEKRIAQLRAIIEKYKTQYSAVLYPRITTLPSGYQKPGQLTSDLAEHLKSTFGVELVFHSKDGKDPYGYTILDMAGKNIFKGSDVIKLKELLAVIPAEKRVQPVKENPYKLHLNNKVTSAEELSYYKTLAHSVVNSYGSLEEGLKHQGFDLVAKANDLYIIDIDAEASIKLDDIIENDSEDYSRFADYAEADFSSNRSFIDEVANVGFSNNDIDDEAILGRNRRRKGMARTNTR